MPRSKTIRQSEFPYNIGSRCVNKEWFNLPLEEVWNIFSMHLYSAKFQFNLKIHSFVLMSNHFHMLVSTPDCNIDLAMKYLIRNVSLSISKESRRINQTFGGRYFRSVVISEHYFSHAYKYIYRNPVQAGLCRYVEDYPYSTLHGILGRSHLLIPVEEDTLIFGDTEGTLKWLNTSPTSADWKAVGAALKKREFKLKRVPKTGDPHILEQKLF